jgi:hypothetical protein
MTLSYIVPGQTIRQYTGDESGNTNTTARAAGKARA